MDFRLVVGGKPCRSFLRCWREPRPGLGGISGGLPAFVGRRVPYREPPAPLVAGQCPLLAERGRGYNVRARIKGCTAVILLLG